MLTLGRRPGEKILIGEDVWVVVLAVERGRVRLGIDAPGQPVNRAELLLAGDRHPPRDFGTAGKGGGR